jgi:hypothetical protein
MADYTDLQRCLNRLFPNSTTYDANAQAILPDLITRASRQIDAWCKRPDNAFAPTEQIRLYDVPQSLQGPAYYTRDQTLKSMQAQGNWPNVIARVVDIDPLVQLSEVRTDQDGDGVCETVMTFGVDFDLLPLNAPQDNYPYRRLRVLPNGRFQLPIGIRTLQVAGQFGYPTPPPIQEATELTVLRWYKRPTDALGVHSSTLGGAAVTAKFEIPDPDVFSILSSGGWVAQFVIV